MGQRAGAPSARSRRPARRLQPLQAPLRGRLSRSTGTAGSSGGSSRSGRRSRGSLPRTDVFHFYFGLTLVPRSVQFPILGALRKKSVMHYLGSDIRGKSPQELAFGKKAGAEVVGSYDAIRWVPEAEMIPPGIDVSAIEPAPPTDRARPVILHAPSSRRRKGTEEVIAACEGLDADLMLVEGLHHDEAFERYREADIVVDQLNAGWYGLFAIECMALGKPVVTFLHDEAVARTETELGTRVPIVSATKETPARAARAARRLSRRAQADRRRVARVRRAGARPRARRRPPARSLRSPLMCSSAQSSSGSASTRRSTGSAGSSRASSPSSSCRSTRATSRPPTTA